MKIRCVYKVNFLRGFQIQAITLYPWILFSQPQDQISEQLFRHELEHFYQVERIGFLGFYYSYLRFYFSLRRKGHSHSSAYWNNPFEIEARDREVLPLSKTEWQLLSFEKV